MGSQGLGSQGLNSEGLRTKGGSGQGLQEQSLARGKGLKEASAAACRRPGSAALPLVAVRIDLGCPVRETDDAIPRQDPHGRDTPGFGQRVACSFTA